MALTASDLFNAVVVLSGLLIGFVAWMTRMAFLMGEIRTTLTNDLKSLRDDHGEILRRVDHHSDLIDEHGRDIANIKGVLGASHK